MSSLFMEDGFWLFFAGRNVNAREVAAVGRVKIRRTGWEKEGRETDLMRFEPMSTSCYWPGFCDW